MSTPFLQDPKRVEGENTADNTFASDQVVANAQGSVLERLEDLRALAGSRFSIKKTLVSSAILQTGVDLTGACTGDLFIEDIILQTDATGLAAGTNLTIGSNNANGGAVNMSTAVSGLGANKTIDFANASVTKLKGVLESGKKLVAKMTAADGTGAGTVDVYIVFRRRAAGATVAAA